MGNERQIEEKGYLIESGIFLNSSFSLLLIFFIDVIIMHPSDSLFTGVKRVDYRNARYEGLIHSTTSRRHGFGILLDDDMNLYCSEWDNGRLSGSTFIALSSGHFFYGVWKNNEPNGLNIYRSR